MRTVPASTVFLLATLPCSLSAQDPSHDPTQPAPEAKRFDCLLGTWQGSGTWRSAPGGEAAKWTATSTNRRVFNGHFVQSDSRIDLGPTVPAPLVFRTFHAYDRENARYMTYGCSNAGEIDSSEVHWEGKNKMVTTSAMRRHGKLVVERWVTTVDGDTMTIRGQQGLDSGEFFVHVEGTYERSKVEAATAKKGQKGPSTHMLVAPLAETATEMKWLSRCAGTYRMTGKMIPAPGAPEMEIAGEEVIAPVFGGTLLEFQVTGDPAPGMPQYRAWGAMCWSPAKNCYMHVFVDNMGDGGVEVAHRVGDDIVILGHGKRFGQPALQRSIMGMDEKGTVTKVVGTSILGKGEAEVTFRGEWKRVEATGK